MIFTGLTALYKRGIIDFNPSCLYISLRHGKDFIGNIENRLKVKEVKVDLETKTFGIFAENWKDEKVYSVERLLIEINKWSMSTEMREKAINRLIKLSKPHLLMESYKQVFKKRRGYDLDYRVVQILEHYRKPIDVILNGDSQKNINEYFLKQIEDLKLPIIIKGGTAIQMYWDTNRKTLDIDSHSIKDKMAEIIDKITNSKNAIRFKPFLLGHKKGLDIIGDKFTLNKINNKNIIKLAMVPVVYGNVNKLKGFFVKFTINTSISNIEKMVEDFHLTKRKIGVFNADVLIFKKEMLIAEKYHSLIMKPLNTKRSKDLLDIWFLSENKYDSKLVEKWLRIKFASSRISKKWEDSLKIIKDNYEIKLPKILDQWVETNEMFSIDIKFEDAFKKYYQISLAILKTRNK